MTVRSSSLGLTSLLSQLCAHLSCSPYTTFDSTERWSAEPRSSTSWPWLASVPNLAGLGISSFPLRVHHICWCHHSGRLRPVSSRSCCVQLSYTFLHGVRPVQLYQRRGERLLASFAQVMERVLRFSMCLPLSLTSVEVYRYLT